MKKSQEGLKKTGKFPDNKYFNNGEEISKSTFYRLKFVERKSQINGKVPQKSQGDKIKPAPVSRKSKLAQEKELIDYKALSQYIAILQLAEMYRKHFGNKTIRVTDRLKRYINQPEDMIRMSLILERNR